MNSELSLALAALDSFEAAAGSVALAHLEKRKTRGLDFAGLTRSRPRGSSAFSTSRLEPCARRRNAVAAGPRAAGACEEAAGSVRSTFAKLSLALTRADRLEAALAVSDAGSAISATSPDKASDIAKARAALSLAA